MYLLERSSDTQSVPCGSTQVKTTPRFLQMYSVGRSQRYLMKDTTVTVLWLFYLFDALALSRGVYIHAQTATSTDIRFYEQIRGILCKGAQKSWSKERQRCSIPIAVPSDGGPHDELGNDIGAVSGARYVNLRRVSLLGFSKVWLPVPKVVILEVIQEWHISCHTVHICQSQLKSRV